MPAKGTATPFLDRKLLEVGKLVGSGANGVVVFGKYKTLPVAIKVFTALPKGTNSKAFEARAAAILALAHNDVLLHPLGFIPPDKTISGLVVMEQMEMNVEHAMGAGLLTPGDLEDVVRALLMAVVGLHSLGMVHGNLKPSNVLLSNNQREGFPGNKRWRIKVSDFGAIVADYPVTATKLDPMEWLHYRAPEVLANGRAPPTMAADIYSLALLIVEIGTNGMSVYNAAMGYQVLVACAASEETRVVPPKTFSPVLAKLLPKMWASDPKARCDAKEVVKLLGPGVGPLLIPEPELKPRVGGRLDPKLIKQRTEAQDVNLRDLQTILNTDNFDFFQRIARQRGVELPPIWQVDPVVCYGGYFVPPPHWDGETFPSVYAGQLVVGTIAMPPQAPGWDGHPPSGASKQPQPMAGPANDTLPFASVQAHREPSAAEVDARRAAETAEVKPWLDEANARGDAAKAAAKSAAKPAAKAAAKSDAKPAAKSAAKPAGKK
jgi:serine/threonine protein kinase